MPWKNQKRIKETGYWRKPYRRRSTPLERFNANYDVDTVTGCWNWTGYRMPTGYGSFWLDRPIAASRAAWILLRGPVADDVEVCHHCDNPPCVNPDHLFIGTHRDNMLDCFGKGYRRVPKGEDYSSTKLTAEQVREIRRSPLRHSELAHKFHVEAGTIRRTRLGENWAHLPMGTWKKPTRRSPPWAKLTDDNVREILRSPLTGVELARVFKVSMAVISLIRLRRSYKHITQGGDSNS